MATVRPTVPPAPRPVVVVSTFWTWVALLLALIGVAGSLYMSLGLVFDFGLNMFPCPLCFYQRALVMGIAAVLLMGLLAGPARSGFLSAVTMPLTVAALALAGYQIYMELDKQIRCPDGVIANTYLDIKGEKDDIYKQMHEVVTTPRESAGLFFLLFLAQFIDVARSSSRGGFGAGAIVAALVVGAAMFVGLMATAALSETPLPPTTLPSCRPLR